MMHLSNPQTYNPKYFSELQILNLMNFKATLVRQAWHSCPPRTTDTQRELFFKNSKLLGLGRQIGPKFFEAFGVFSAKLLKVVQTKLIID